MLTCFGLNTSPATPTSTIVMLINNIDVRLTNGSRLYTDMDNGV